MLTDLMGAIKDYSISIELTSEKIPGTIDNYSKAKTFLAYDERAQAKYNLEDYVGALSDFTKLIEFDPKYINAYLFRGHSKGNLGDYRGAINDYTQIIEIDTKNSTAYFVRGMCKIKHNMKDSGCLDLSKAGELGDPVAYYYIKKNCQ